MKDREKPDKKGKEGKGRTSTICTPCLRFDVLAHVTPCKSELRGRCLSCVAPLAPTRPLKATVAVVVIVHARSLPCDSIHDGVRMISRHRERKTPREMRSHLSQSRERQREQKTHARTEMTR